MTTSAYDLKFDPKYKLLMAAEVGLAGGLFTKFVGITGVEHAFLKPAMWIAASTFASSCLVYGFEHYGGGTSAIGSLDKDFTPKVANALLSGATYGMWCRFMSHKCSNMGAVKMAGVAAAATFAGELLAPLTVDPVFKNMGMR